MCAAIRTEREDSKFRAYAQALLSTGNTADVLKALFELEVPKPYRVRVKVLYSRSSPSAVFKDLQEENKLHSLSQSADSYSFTKTIGKNPQRPVEASFLVTSFQDSTISDRVQAVISVCRTDEWKVLSRLIKDEYPHLVPILLSQTELIAGARKLRLLSGHNVRVKNFSAKEKLNGSGDKSRKSVRQWTDENLDEALRVIGERRQVLSSLEVEFFPKVGDRAHVVPRATCKTRKNGEIEVTGSFGLAFEAVAKEVARVGEKKLQNFSGRGLREAAYKPRPLAINFQQRIFDDLETVRGFVHLLAKYPRSMHAVEHGNPYAHVKITDLFDYSAFEVWAIPPSRIALLPGLKASEAAFERLVHHIFDGFKEGQVVEYERRERGAAESA